VRTTSGDAQVIDAEVPLREILSYSKDLEKLTHGEGDFSFRLQGYREVVAPELEKKILEEQGATGRPQ